MARRRPGLAQEAPAAGRRRPRRMPIGARAAPRLVAVAEDGPVVGVLADPHARRAARRSSGAISSTSAPARRRRARAPRQDRAPSTLGAAQLEAHAGLGPQRRPDRRRASDAACQARRSPPRRTTIRGWRPPARRAAARRRARRVRAERQLDGERQTRRQTRGRPPARGRRVETRTGGISRRHRARRRQCAGLPPAPSDAGNRGSGST